MAEKLADMGIAATIVPNTAMLLSGGLRDTTRKPADIRPIALHRIDVGDRQRPLDKAAVEALAASIKQEGLLQPIGVRRSTKPGGNFELIYGYHRLAAARLIAKEDPTQDGIAAVIYPEKMPDWACEMAEIAENKFRKNLTPKENEAQTTIYAGLLKKHGKVKPADEVRRANAKNQHTKEGQEHHVPHPETDGKSVTKQVAADLGITPMTVRRHVANAVKTAKSIGFHIDKTTPEELSGDAMIAIGKAAAMAEAKREPSYKPEEQPRPSLTLNAQPEKFVQWCRARVAGRDNAAALETLRAYRRTIEEHGKALDELIKEYEAKS